MSQLYAKKDNIQIPTSFVPDRTLLWNTEKREIAQITY